MRLPFLLYIKTLRELTTEFWKSNFSTIEQWWNDHDSGAKAWTNLSAYGLNMNSNKIINLANGAASTDAINLSQLTVFQVQYARNTSTTTTTSASYQTTGLSVTITPSVSSHRILVMAFGPGFNAATSTAATFSIFRGTTDLAFSSSGFAVVNSDTTNMVVPVSMMVVDSPSTTSATTYTVRLYSNGGGSVKWGSTNTTQTIVAIEIT